MNIFEGKNQAAEYKFAVIVSRFNESITNKLLDGAVKCLENYGCKNDNYDIFKVPGAFEIPFLADRIASLKKYNAIICLGAVIKGATPHFDYVASNSSNGISKTAVKHGIPVSFGILTTNTLEQAIERSGGKSGNKGWDAAAAAIEMADLMRQISREK